MFWKKKTLPKEFVDLYIEASATKELDTPMWELCSRTLNWFDHNMPYEIADIRERVNLRRDEIQKESDEEAKRLESKKTVPRRIEVPEPEAQRTIEMWEDYKRYVENTPQYYQAHLYRFEKHLYSVCSQIREWGYNPDYNVVVEDCRVWVVESLDGE